MESVPSLSTIRSEWAEMDIYLFSLLQKGHIISDFQILDAGCGYGRNSWYFLKLGMDVWGVDISEEDVRWLATFARESGYPHDDRFSVQKLEELSLPDGYFDLVICNAVLHFSPDKESLEKQLHQLKRVTKKGGIIFIRTATNDGLMDDTSNPLFPMVLSKAAIESYNEKLGFTWLEPYKTVLTSTNRSMCVWVVVKS